MTKRDLISKPEITRKSDYVGIDLAGLFYVEDNTKHGNAQNPVDKRDRGYWVMMKESEEGNMIVFTGLRLEIAIQLKDRLEKAVIRHIMQGMAATKDD